VRDISGREDLSRQIWGLLAFTLWFDRDAREPASAGNSVLRNRQWRRRLGLAAIAAPVEPEVEEGVMRELDTGTFVAVDPDTGEQAAVDADTGEFESLQASTADQPEVNPPQPPPQPARAPGRRGS
jgi:hypothetical protein